MGLSSKQVSSDGLDWKQLLQTGALDIPKAPQARQQQQSPPLKCPRCDSNNTKFCYYNNYNRSQPRHFCKACRRHWTKGGTLRNVPVGGGRKNKRLKTSTNSNTSATSRQSTNISVTNSIAIQQQLPLGLPDHKTFSEILYNSFYHQPPPLPQPRYINNNNEENNNSNINNNNSTFNGSLLSLPPIPHFPLPSYDNSDPSNSVSLQPLFFSTVTAKAEDSLSLPFDSVQGEDGRGTTPWQIPTSNLLDSSSWSWEDFTNFVSQPLQDSHFP